jgi:hypothetical protein
MPKVRSFSRRDRGVRRSLNVKVLFKDYNIENTLGVDMNIFVLDKNPQNAAIMMCDKHVVKMIVETAQMLCTVARNNGHDAPYRSTHARHPCTLWAAETRGNWDWLVQHGMALCSEYTRRYGKTHKTQAVMEWARNSNVGPTASLRLTPFRLAMPPQYKQACPVQSYRDYYMGEKSRFAKWKLGAPYWWSPSLKSSGQVATAGGR